MFLFSFVSSNSFVCPTGDKKKFEHEKKVQNMYFSSLKSNFLLLNFLFILLKTWYLIGIVIFFKSYLLKKTKKLYIKIAYPYFV